MQGMASVISAKGSANLSNSQAAINMTQAQSQEIQNKQANTAAYFNMRSMNQAAVAKEQGPPPSSEQMARMAADGAPQRLTTAQWDPISGKVNWPDLLQEDTFADLRAQIESLLALQTLQGRLGYTQHKDALTATNAMFKKLRAEISAVSPEDYTESRSFLTSLTYTLTKNQLN